MGQAASSNAGSSGKVVFKEVQKGLEKSRGNLVNKLEGQHYSLTEEFPCFTENRGVDAKLDLCVLANMPTRDLKILRKTCQDDAAVVKLNDDAYIMGVFDGHGPRGERVSQTCIHLLRERFLEDSAVEEFLTDPSNAMHTMIYDLHDVVSKLKEVDPVNSGTTATVAFLHKDKLHVSWVGDSSAILLATYHERFLEMDAFKLTKEHNFQSAEELQRVKEKGGIITTSVVDESTGESVSRVWNNRTYSRPGLAMSKSIGDLLAHELGCSAEADSITLDLRNLPKEFLPSEYARIRGFDSLSKNESFAEAAGGTGIPKMPSLSALRKGSKPRAGSQVSLNSNFGAVTPVGDGASTNLENSSSLENSELMRFKLGSSKKISLNENGKKKKRSSKMKKRSTIQAKRSPEDVKHTILVIASDGVWNVMTKEEVGRFLSYKLHKRCLHLSGEELNDEETMKSLETNLSTMLCLRAQKIYLQKLGKAPAQTDDISAIVAVMF